MSFENDIAAFAARANTNVNTVVKSVVLRIASEVIRKSPVDTGRFKGNWQYGVSVAPVGNLATTDTNGGATVSRIASQMPDNAADAVHYIANNLPYAQGLEDGYSMQSPPGNMVAGTVAEFRRFVAEAAR